MELMNNDSMQKYIFFIFWQPALEFLLCIRCVALFYVLFFIQQ